MISLKNKITLFLLAILSASCTSQTSQKIDAQAFANKINSSENTILLDVRTPEEYNRYHIENAININVYDKNFEEQLNDLDKSKTILVYCKSGSRSENAAHTLVKKGFKNVFELEGGLLTWEAAKLPLASFSAPATNQYTLATFQQVVDSNKLVLVDFFAEWCGPCKMMTPHITALLEEYGDQITLLKVDTDKSPEISRHFQINGIPRIKIYANQKEVYDQVGFHSKEALVSALKSYL